MKKNTSVEAVGKIVEILEGLPPDDRSKAVRAAIILLGETLPSPAVIANATEGVMDREDTLDAIPPRAGIWLKNNGISTTQLLRVFHIDERGVDVIAEIPGEQ